MDKKNIPLTKEETRDFMLFMNHREKFRILAEAGAFELEVGKIEINCYNNEIRDVKIAKITYQKRKLKVEENNNKQQ